MLRNLVAGVCCAAIAVAVLSIAAVGLARVGTAADQTLPGSRCSGLVQAKYNIRDIPQLHIVSAAPAHSEDGSYEYCRVEGRLDALIEFEADLPTISWNGKFLAIFSESCDIYLRRGYACLPIYRNGLRGKPGMGRSDEEFEELQMKGLVPWLEATRFTHLLTLVGKDLTARFYSKPAKRSYFLGCSAGGSDAIWEAQQFPYDYDGVVAGEFTPDVNEWLVNNLWMTRNLIGSNGSPIFSAQSLQTLHSAALHGCKRETVAGGSFVANPLECVFDPSKLLCGAKGGRCLTLAQVEAAKKLYRGPSNRSGVRETVYRTLPGSELRWRPMIMDRSIDFEYGFYGSKPKVTDKNFDFEDDFKRLGFGNLNSPISPDLRRFQAAGGKLIAYQGGNDTASTASSVEDYMMTAERIVGPGKKGRDFLRFFVIPGMDHCNGGQGAYEVDYLTYIERWVEGGTAPNAIRGAHISDAYLDKLPSSSEDYAYRSEDTATSAPLPSHMKLDHIPLPLHPDVPTTFTQSIPAHSLSGR